MNHRRIGRAWGVLCLLVVVPMGWADVQVRVATFNIENFDPNNPTQLDAAVAILNRLGADVVCVQEIDLFSDLNSLALATGYSYKVLASGTNSFDGSHHAGVLSKHAFMYTATETSITLSGDPNARDITRNFIVAVIAVPGAAENLVIIGNHWKSGFEDADEFRRSIESLRAMQVTADYDSSVIPYLVMGDMNDDIADSADSPSQFTSLPGGLPFDYTLGNDIHFPVQNSVFKPLQLATGSQDLTVLAAYQKDGSSATRISGRRLDYVWYSNAVAIGGAEVYDSQDEGLGGGLPKYGSPLPSGTSAAASDHMPVFADILIPDNNSGACCTACGCNDTVNEAECLALGGEFRGADVVCGQEVPPCAALPSDIRFNEVLLYHDGATSREFLELFGQPHDLLCGLTILVVEGEGTLSKGEVDWAISLDDCGGSPCALDANGYFTVGGSGLNPTPDITLSGTNVFENGTETFLLVRDCLVDDSADIDANNDGIADMPVGTILDALAIVDSGYPSDKVYFSPPVSGPDQGGGVPSGAARCPNGVDTDTASDWVRLSYYLDGTDGCLVPTPHAPNPAACGGDANGDGDHDLEDFVAFQQCLGSANAACAALELDGQCGTTLGDFSLWTPLLTGP